MDRKDLERSARRHLTALDPHIGPASFRGQARIRKLARVWARRMAGRKGPDQSWATACALALDPDDWRDLAGDGGHERRALFNKLAQIAERHEAGIARATRLTARAPDLAAAVE